MSTPPDKPSAITKFIGEDAAAGGPFALLGVPYELSDPQVRRALSRRLAQIDQHPHARTPDADEVRLALHTAASQLLDDQLREQLKASWPPGTEQTTPAAWQPRKGTRVQDRVIRSARRVLAMSGGWNARSRKQLAHLARINRIPAIELIRALTGDRDRGGARKTPTKPAKRVFPRPPGSLAGWTALYAFLGFMMFTLLFRSYMPSADSTNNSNGAASSDATNPPAGEPLESAATNRTGSKRSITHYTALLHEVAQAERVASVDPNGAAERVSQTIPAFRAIWTAIPPEELEELVHTLQRIHIAVQADQAAKQTLQDALLDFSADTTPAKTIAANALRAHLAHDSSLQLPFADELIASAEQLAEDATTDDPAWWSSWLDAVEAVHPKSTDAQSQVVLRALSRRLQAPAPSTSWDAAARLFANALSWRPGSPERSWMLGVFVDPAVIPERLAALTEAIATDSSASGILVTMVLRPDATMEQRAELASRYRASWASSSTDPFIDRLTDSLLSAISLTSPDPSADQAVDRFAELARLNAACALIDRGDAARALIIFESALTATHDQTAPTDLGIAHNPEDDQLSIELVNADSTDSELAALYQIESRASIGLNTAHAIVQVALTGSGRESRDYAAGMISSNREALPILLALDRILIVNRTTSRMQLIISSVVQLPSSARTTQWDAMAHRALLRAIASAAVGGKDSTAIGYEKLIGAFYSPRISMQPASDLDSTAIGSLLISQLGAELLQSVESDRVQRIVQRRHVRLLRAESVAQRFAADQQALVDLHALSLSERLPGSAAQISLIMEELDSRCQQAQTVQGQITQLERAQAQLWLLSFRQGRL